MKIHTFVLGPIEANCYVIETENGGCVIVDPGYYGREIVKKLKKLYLNPKAILITHGHYDHIGGIDGIIESFPDVLIYIGKDELDVVDYSSDMLENKTSAELIKNEATLVSDGDIIKVENLEFKVVRTPGHSKGGVVYLCEGVMFSGDTLFYREIGRCDLFTGDYEVMLRTLRKLVSLNIDYIVYPGHGKPTSIAEEKLHNQYIKLALSK